MKILHISNYLPTYHRRWSGAEQACFRFLYLLDKYNYNINVVTTKPLKSPKEGYNFFFINTLEDLLPSYRLKYFYCRIRSIIPFDPIVFIQFHQLILRIKPDIIHLYNFENLTFSVVCVANIFKIPVIASIYDYWYFCPKTNLMDREGKTCFKFHGNSCASCLDTPIYFRYLLKLRKIFFDLFLNRINAFIVLSESSSLILQQYGIDKKKINIIYQPSPFRGIPSEEIAWEIENPFLLFIGNLSFNKGVHIAIESLAYIRKEMPDVRLYIVGVAKESADKACTSLINQILKQHKLEESVVFLDRLSPTKIYSILKKANAVIIPEQWSNMSPVVLMEAMILAKPIVASKIGGIPEFIRNGENGFLVNPIDPSEFAQKIIWILKNPESAKKLGENAKLDALKICNDDINLKKIIELYESLLYL